MDKMQDNFLGQINRIISNSHMRADLQEEKRAESERQAQAMRAQQRAGDESRARNIERLTKEVSILERRQQKRWEELVHANTWDSYEKDKEALLIDTKLQETRDLIQSLFDDMPSTRENTAESNASESNLQSEYDEIMIMAPRPGSKREGDEILIRVKRGENQAHIKHLPNGPEGYVDLAVSIRHLIEDKRSRESSSAEPKLSSKPKYLGYRSNPKEKNEQANKKRRVEDPKTAHGKEEKVERFQIGQRIYYFHDEPGNEKWHEARVIEHLYPGDDDYPAGQNQVFYRIQPAREKGQKYQSTIRRGSELRAWDWAKPCLVANAGKETQPLLPLDRVGIDTCSALSVSSRKDDFLWLDETKEAKRSVILRGVGGDTATIGGRGPMVVEALDKEGNRMVMFDPSVVYLKEAVNQAGFRIFGQQRLKRFGFNLQQNDVEHGGDILNYNNGLKVTPLETNGGILTLRTMPLELSPPQKKNLEKEIDDVIKGGDNLNYCLQLEHQTSMIMNEAYLTKEEADRLHHWRVGHRIVGKSSLNEVCPVCIEGKKKVGSFKRNFEFHGHTTGPPLPYFRLYCDGYGGQKSMGDVSYQGGIGGFVFACPTGCIKTKLYGSTEQFPSILYQVLQEIESEGFITREIYVDTHSVNLSRAAEEVAAMYKVKIIPVSAGTPQEMAYAESAVRTIGQMSRTLMCGAPHLPKFCWGLADLYATEIHQTQPQAKNRCSPYETRTNRKPDLDVFVH